MINYCNAFRAAGSAEKAKQELQRKIEEFLGENPKKPIKNKHNDTIFMSGDGSKRVRADINNSHGDSPHIHFEKLNSTGRRWKDAFETHRFKPGK